MVKSFKPSSSRTTMANITRPRLKKQTKRIWRKKIISLKIIFKRITEVSEGFIFSFIKVPAFSESHKGDQKSMILANNLVVVFFFFFPRLKRHFLIM